METWRTSRVLNGQTSLTRGRRQSTDWTGAENSDCGTCLPRQPHKGGCSSRKEFGITNLSIEIAANAWKNFGLAMVGHSQSI
jgi:hypothetical protein